jgi:nucleoside-diphosphate-sugar epimerase
LTLKGKPVLVTGGAGFIGSSLVKRLLELDADVHVADDFSRGSEENLRPFLEQVTLHRADLTQLENCLEAVSEVEYVFHLAASVGGIHYITKENVAGSTPSLLMNTNMLEAARQHDVKHFLFASSACVYAEKNSALNKFREEDAYPANPLTTYGWAKLMGEIQCKSYFLDYGIKSASARIFNAYGENENLDPKSAHVIPALIRRAILYPKEGFKMFGDGKQERAFLYVRDCVEGLMRCAERITNAEPVNLGNEELVSIGQLAKNVIRFSGKRIDLEYDPAGPQGTHRYCADTTKMKKLLDWAPETPLEEGLRRTFNWARTRLNVEK